MATECAVLRKNRVQNAKFPAVNAGAPTQAPPPVTEAKGGRGPLVAIVLVVVIVVVALLAYAGVGFAYSQGRLSSAKDAYNGVVDHVNKYTDAMNALTNNLTKTNLSTATTADLQQTRTAVAGFVSTSQDAQGRIGPDDDSLSKASNDLQQNSWLTAINKSEIDKTTTRIGHLRKALGDAKVVTADYVQLGTFYESFYDMLIDFDAIGSQSNASALSAGVAKIKTDVGKAISQDKAPGLPADMDSFLKDVQKTADDFTALLNAAAAGDQAGADAANTAVQNDATKLDAYDFNKIASSIDAFYKPMIDDYNAEVERANNT